jgi:hypothetical protein
MSKVRAVYEKPWFTLEICHEREPIREFPEPDNRFQSGTRKTATVNGIRIPYVVGELLWRLLLRRQRSRAR